MKVSFTNGPVTVIVELEDSVIEDIAGQTASDYGVRMSDFQFDEIDGYV